MRFGSVDAVLAVAGLAAGAAGVVLGLTLWSVDRTPALVFAPALTVVIFITAAAMFIGVIAAALLAIARA